MSLRWCNRCVLPSTRPNLEIGSDGVCNACRSWSSKKTIDWDTRKSAFDQVVQNAKKHSSGYDCLIPVSGGKDSTWQTVVCLEHGLKPLAVTWKTPARTAIGQRNLDNLINLGVDHIDYQVSPKVERTFMYESLIRFGTPAIPMHMALFNIPLKIAFSFKIPLVVWGENSAFEYGGTEDETQGFQLDRKWLTKYGVTHGTTANDWVSPSLSEADLTPYLGPTEKELAARGVRAIFLGYYFPWDTELSLRVAKAHGFSEEASGPRTGLYNYADIDDEFISIHHYLKWYKFGFTRLFDNLSIEIRAGRLTREAAVEIIRKTGDQTPRGDIEKLCAFLDITPTHFYEVIEKFRNREIWYQENGTWKIRDFLIPDWRWQ